MPAVPQVQTFHFADDGRIPNNPALPLLVYPAALLDALETLDAAACQALFRRNGWSGSWVNGVFSYHHYHSVAHEVLGCVSGSARVQFGGPEGAIIDVVTGAVVVIPAGVGHCKLSGSGDFRVVGAYPPGQERYDLHTGEPGERPRVLANIRQTALPHTDPVYGASGPLLALWGAG